MRGAINEKRQSSEQAALYSSVRYLGSCTSTYVRTYNHKVSPDDKLNHLLQGRLHMESVA